MLDAGYIAPGDSVIDPFGGIAAGAYDALVFGLHWQGVELEPRFVELGNANIDKYRRDLAMLNGQLGTARLLQGDSRRLAEVVGARVAAVVSSPPYETDALGHSRGQAGVTRELSGQYDRLGISSRVTDYADNTPGQLGSMRSGDYAAVVSSPPFGEGETRNRTEYAPGFVSDMMSRAYTQDRQGTTPGNLATLRADDTGFATAVSSPPYADAVNGTGEGPGARHDPIYHNGDNAYKTSSAAGYGTSAGNLGNMSGDGFGAAVSSPPYEASVSGKQSGGGRGIDTSKFANPGKHIPGEKAIGANMAAAFEYGSDPANIGNDTGETFWTAARLIVEQTYAVLRPGGYTAWVCKDFVRKGQRVPFSDQWEALCAAVGFMRVERIAALLVEDHGDQLDIFGGSTARRKERKSFFRRLAEKNGSPRIDHEDVIIMRKPL
jgi:hypothetical protein